MGRWLYSLVLYLVFPFVLGLLFYRRLRDPAYGRRWQERLGYVPVLAPGCIWVHAVSVGEALAAIPLIRRLQQRYPTRRILVTTMTPTGSERVQAALGETVDHVYAPYDLPHLVRRFLQRVKPAMMVIMETEVWPNIVHQCYQRQIPVILANARMSESSARGYLRGGALVRPVFQQLAWVAAQADADAERFRRLGVEEERLSVTGSIKYDVAIGQKLRADAAALREQLGDRPVWIAASTHDGEDEPLLAAHAELRRYYPRALMILVPRHPERFSSVARRVRHAGLSLARRSKGESAADRAVYLGDTMGELLMLFGAAEVAFVGGSLIPRGGHNPLEPAAWTLPVIMGPHVFNFASVCQRLGDSGGLITVADEAALASQLRQLLGDPERRQRVGEAARAVIARNRGALDRLEAGITHHLSEAGPSD